MPENEPSPAGDDIDDILLRRVTPEAVEEYTRLKKEYKDIFRVVKKRHRGEVREQLLRHHAAEFQKRVRGLVDRALGQEG